MVDTNVIIDFLMTREPFYKASAEVLTKCAGKELDGYIALHSISNLWYILRKIPEDKRRKWLIDICQCLYVEGICHEDVIKPISSSLHIFFLELARHFLFCQKIHSNILKFYIQDGDEALGKAFLPFSVQFA